MTLFLMVFSIVCAFFLENAIARFLPFIPFAPPLVLLAVFYWLWHGEKNKYTAPLAVAAFFLESVSLFFPGSYVVVLLVLAFLTPLLKQHVANLDSLRVQAAVFAFFLFLTAAVMKLYMFFFEKIKGAGLPIAWRFEEFFWWMIVWSFVYVCFLHFICRPVLRAWRINFQRRL